MKRSYAAVWSIGERVDSGRVEVYSDRFELHGRGRRLSLPFGGIAGASIARRGSERLRGLPVLVLRDREGDTVRLASLEGAGVLHELVGEAQSVALRLAK